MTTWHIHIEGQVQGVGFRPFIFGLANKLGLKGWVNNTTDGVHIVFNATASEALALKDTILATAPSLSRITALELREESPSTFTQFEIVHSEASATPNLLLTPDFALCSACREEVRTEKDRRYDYPFTTCTNCGPRFSIIKILPYDRVNTTMAPFDMCPSCQSEYDDPLDRRYYSQTNSDPDCSVLLTLYDADRQEISQATKEILDYIPQAWEVGKIVAIKGIGGYLLTCDASNETAVAELRNRKHRPRKPFAVMYPREKLAQDFSTDQEEWKTLDSPIAPIVLLDKSLDTPAFNGVSPGLEQVGVMIPYAPLFECLLQRFSRAIVATSGNLSNSPIVYQDDKAIKELAGVADLVLVNNREIVIPQDDSVLTHTPFQKQRIIIRRSRGLAPTYINPDLDLPKEELLAMGAMLKSTFSLLKSSNVYVSQYLGDLEHFDAQLHYQHTIQHFLNLFRSKPEVILIDQHPGYPSTQIGKELAAEYGISVYPVQHHHAAYQGADTRDDMGWYWFRPGSTDLGRRVLCL